MTRGGSGSATQRGRYSFALAVPRDPPGDASYRPISTRVRPPAGSGCQRDAGGKR